MRSARSSDKSALWESGCKQERGRKIERAKKKSFHNAIIPPMEHIFMHARFKMEISLENGIKGGEKR